MKYEEKLQAELNSAGRELSAIIGIGGFLLGLFIGSVLISGLLS